MPTLQANGVQLHYEDYGSGDETIVFSHGYLMSHKMFAAQIDALKDHYRVIAYDHRCHGGSEVVKTEFGMYDLVDDAAALIDQLVGGPVHFIGMSTGGYVGVRLMLKRPALLKSAVLIDTGGGGEDAAGLRQYNLMLAVVRWLGVRPVFGRAIQMLMGEKFRTDPARKTEYETWKRYILGLDNVGLFRFGKAIFYRDSVLDQLSQVQIPTLVLVGEDDIPTPIATAEALAGALPNATLATIPNAGHSSPVEEPALVTAAITAFLMDS